MAGDLPQYAAWSYRIVCFVEPVGIPEGGTS